MSRLLWYFLCSLAVLLADAAILVASRNSGGAAVVSDDIIRFALSLLPAAVFGLIAGLLAAVRVGRAGERLFFGLATIFGGVAAYWTYWLFGFPGDCFDDCASTPPSDAARLIVALLAAVPAVIVPAVLYFTRRGVDGRGAGSSD